MACRFPNPIPSGTRVPQWALIDVTVRCYVFFNGKVFTAPSSMRALTSGTQARLLQSVVRTLSLSFSHYQCLTVTSCFLDSPEQVPGVILGPSGATVSASGTGRGATSSLFGESSSTVKPTSSPIPKSSSSTDVIVGTAVGGVVALSLVIAIGFFLRQRRPEAPVPVAPPVVGASQLPMDEIRQPLTEDNGYTTSSTSTPGTIGSFMPGTHVAPMRNVRVSCQIGSMRAHRMRFLAHSFYFDTQDSNYPSTFPGYQGIPQTPATPQGAVQSFNGTGNSLATMQTSRQQGYHGLPTV
jgi:hypothetical protein